MKNNVNQDCREFLLHIRRQKASVSLSRLVLVTIGFLLIGSQLSGQSEKPALVLSMDMNVLHKFQSDDAVPDFITFRNGIGVGPRLQYESRIGSDDYRLYGAVSFMWYNANIEALLPPNFRAPFGDLASRFILDELIWTRSQMTFGAKRIWKGEKTEWSIGLGALLIYENSPAVYFEHDYFDLFTAETYDVIDLEIDHSFEGTRLGLCPELIIDYRRPINGINGLEYMLGIGYSYWGSNRAENGILRIHGGDTIDEYRVNRHRGQFTLRAGLVL